MSKKQKMLTVVGVMLVIMLLPLTVVASDSEGVGFDIQSVIPQNQVNKEKTFYDLRMKPGEKQKIEFILNNTSQEDGVYEVNINQAYTNNQGYIDYSKTDKKPSKSLLYDINDLVEYEREVKVPPHTTKKIPITIKMPDDLFDGQILAGIQVIKKGGGKKAVNQVSNTYDYIIGLKLTETDKKIERSMTLLTIKPAVSFGKTSIVVTLENPMMEAYGQLKYDVVIKQKDKIVKKMTYGGDRQMAPTSTYDFVIDWEGQQLKVGDYRLLLTITDAKENRWQFDEDFTVTAIEAREINNQIKNNEARFTLPTWLTFMLTASISFACLYVTFYWYREKLS